MRLFRVFSVLACSALLFLPSPVKAADNNFARDLKMGASGPDVVALQKFLNEKGFKVSNSGAGSLGMETDYFGSKTREALASYQRASGISPAVGYFGRITRTSISSIQAVGAPSQTIGSSALVPTVTTSSPIPSPVPTPIMVSRSSSCRIPDVDTVSISSIRGDGATVGGNIVSDCSVMERGIAYGKKEGPTVDDAYITAGQGNGGFLSVIKGLSPATSYHVRAYAKNAGGISYGDDRVFTTVDTSFSPMIIGAGCAIPVLSTSAASSILGSSAVSGGNVSDTGGCTVTERGFVWSLAADPTISDNKVTVGSGTGSFSGSMSGLSSATSYHSRAYATNQRGTAYGADTSLTTDRMFIKNTGGSDYEFFGDVIVASDGGYVTTGNTQSLGGDFPRSHLRTDIAIVKYNPTGTVQWYKTYGGNNDEAFYSIRQISGGGYITVGSSDSNEFDLTGQVGLHDGVFLKLDGTGNIVLNKRYGGTQDDVFRDVIQTADGGYLVVGDSKSADGNVPGNYGEEDMLAMKFSSDGSLQWAKNYGTSEYDSLYRIAGETGDGGFIVAGEADGADNDFPGNYGGIGDAAIIKIDSSGDIVWAYNYGGTGCDYIIDIISVSGGYVATGGSEIVDHDVTASQGGGDAMIMKINEVGVLQWMRSVGGSDFDMLEGIKENSDGTFITTGKSWSNDGSIGSNNGDADGFIAKFSSSGILQWVKVYGGSGYDDLSNVGITSDGGYIVAGFSDSVNGDMSGNLGSTDAILIKTDDEGNIE